MHTYLYKEVGQMVDVSQIRQELVDRTKREFEDLHRDEITAQSLRECAEREVRKLPEHRFQAILDNFRIRSWAPDIYVESDGLEATNATLHFKKVIAAEIIHDIVLRSKEWCEKYHITPQGLVAAD